MYNLNETIDTLYDEPVYRDFITRKEFIKETGIFVTPDFFRILYGEFKDSGLTKQEFVETYEKNNSVYICTDKAGIIKYHLEDEDICPITYNDEIPSVLDILYCITNSMHHSQQNIEKCKGIISEYQQELLAIAPSNGVYA